jgi:2-C-methyl-D-erythritol 4-phosphate cytidylyltransferase
MNIAIVLAGGVGARTGLEIPKQFYKIKDREILSYTLTAFENSEKIDTIVIVCLEEYFDKISEIVRKYGITKHIMTVKNGDTRKQSVFNALKSLENIASQDDIVLIHDGIRAMIKPHSIDKCVEETIKYGATTLAQKNSNTVVYSEGHNIQRYIDRNFVYNLQTPQSFKYKIIYDAHKKTEESGDITDDTQIAIKNGIEVHIIENDEPNLKLTTKEDIELFKFYLAEI